VSTVYDVERDKPKRPDPPPMGEQRRRRSLLPVVMVAVPLVIFAAGIVIFTGKAGLLILAAIASVPAFVLLHYLLWGYWLARSMRGPDEPDGDQGQDAD
jgi:hypothetical protein